MTKNPQLEPSLLLQRQNNLLALLDRIWWVMLITTIVAGLSSLLRYSNTGWLTVYGLHLVLMIFFWSSFLFRQKLSYLTRVNILMIIFYLVGILGVLTFGMLGSGFWWLILGNIIAKIYYSKRTSSIHFYAILILIILAAISFTTGFLKVQVDANDYITHTANWISFLFGTVFLYFAIFEAIKAYQNGILELQAAVSERNKALRERQDEIEKLQTFIPICAGCKQIRNDEGYWQTVETYMKNNADLDFSHCLCPDCGEELYGDVWNEAMQIDLDSRKAPHFHKPAKE